MNTKTKWPGLAIAVIAVCSGISSAQTRRALIVGIDRYAPHRTATENRTGSGTAEAGVKPFGNLDGAVNDARALGALLEARYGFESENISLLLDEQATRDGFFESFREHLIDASQEGDIALLFYAGHGSMIRDSRIANGLDPYDQTLIPHDFNEGALPILDKELRYLLGDLLDTGARVTAFFDSCHSGSITRGMLQESKMRWIPPDNRDAAELYDLEPDDRPSPESRGAIIMSAAQDNQRAMEMVDERGVHHGLFSSALLRVLRSEPIDQTALNVYHRVRALVQTESSRQVPQLGGLGGGNRDDASYAATRLIGPTPEGATGGIAVAVRSIEGNRVKLPGGHALGMAAGTELVSVGDQPVTRLRVEDILDLDHSIAKVVEGDVETIEVGALFEVDLWVTQTETFLNVWTDPASLSWEQIQALSEPLDELRDSPDIEWIDDPTLIEDAAEVWVITWDGERWQLDGNRESRTELGESLSSTAVLEALEDELPARLLIRVPPPKRIMEALSSWNAPSASAIGIVKRPEQAHYVLAGRLSGDALCYSWIRPGAFANANADELGMPIRTDWVSFEPDGFDVALNKLRTQAERIGRVREWLRLEAPPEKRPFPYHLLLRDPATKADMGGRDLFEGDKIEIVLHAEKLPRINRSRFVYLLALDSGGGSQLLFGGSLDKNRFPRLGQERQSTFVLLSSTEIRSPFGIDTLVMLTSAEKLTNTHALSWKGVLSEESDRGAPRGAAFGGPLQRLITTFSASTRGKPITTPADWSIERVRFVTRPAAASIPLDE